ncbi:S8 family serine peptidase [Micromonospora sp. URMC 106]
MTAGALTATPGAGVAAPGSGGDAGAARDATPGGGGPVAFAGPESTSITLITGDTVEYTRFGDGRVAATIDPAPGREGVSYRLRTAEDGHYYALPSDGQAAIASGLLDERLFDLSYLAENAYADARTAEVPVIVRYEQDISAARLTAKAKTLRGASRSRGLDSVNGAAVAVAKKKATDFWRDVIDPKSGLEKVWLDGRVKALDDVSNGQIGAPTAWQAGYTGKGVKVAIIDTGIDDTHPDLAGTVVSERNFIPAGRPGGGTPDDAKDGHGHGTHVASIVTGSGAASDGRYRGVAAGVDLAIAKALDDNGGGTDSEIIAAMEWAAGPQDAAIVSMSLGGGATDGTDPLSLAVNDLTAEHGTLFVIAAGNDGPGAGTVAAPGAADAALTVGAVDANDQLASFSSRGPRLGDFAIKPEITAPGVNTVAARAAGTTMGTPLNDRYTAASGTSMATPHVAAAAAILAQQHPDWTNSQLKTALVGSAASVSGTVYEHGAGRLDVGRAVTQPITVDTPKVSGRFDHPYTGQTLTRTITYHNSGSSPVELDLDLSMTGENGSPAPSGFATLDRDRITVPASGSASVTLTMEPTAGAAGVFTGRLRAGNAAGNQVVVPLSARLGAKMATLTVRLVGRPGQPIEPSAAYTVGAMMLNDTDPKLEGAPRSYTSDWNGWRRVEGTQDTWEVKMRVAEGGIYGVETIANDRAAGSPPNSYVHTNLLFEPEVPVPGDATVTFDLAKTTPVTFQTEQASVPHTANFAWGYVAASGRAYNGAQTAAGYLNAGYYRVSPTKPGAPGRFWFSPDVIQIAPEALLDLGGRQGPMPARYADDYGSLLRPQAAAFETDRRSRLVGADVLDAGGDVRGALVFVPARSQQEMFAATDAAIAGRAAGLVTDMTLPTDPLRYGEIDLPVLIVDTATAGKLVAAVAEKASPPVTIRAQMQAPYEYKIVHYFNDGIPESMPQPARDADLAQVRATYHADQPAVNGSRRPLPDTVEVNHAYNPWQFISIKAGHSFVGRTTRTDYHTITGPDVVWDRTLHVGDLATANLYTVVSSRAFSAPERSEESWNELRIPGNSQRGPGIRPEIYRSHAMPCDSCRTGDVLRFRSLHAVGTGQYTDAGDPTHLALEGEQAEQARLYRLDARGNATELTPAYDAYQLPYYTLPAEASTYRATSSYKPDRAGQRYGKQIDTTWTFRSQRPTTSTVQQPNTCLEHVLYGKTDPCVWEPMIMPSYQLGLSVNNTAPVGRHRITVSAQSGAGITTELAGVRMWTSPDGGRTWKPASVKAGPDHTFQVTYQNPKAADTTNATVSLKLEAWDTDGNRVEQVVRDAYGLTKK